MGVSHHELTVPELGLGERAVAVSLWLVEEGSEVSQGDRLVELVAGEVTIDLPSPASGVLVKALVEEDELVIVGQPLARIAASD